MKQEKPVTGFSGRLIAIGSGVSILLFAVQQFLTSDFPV